MGCSHSKKKSKGKKGEKKQKHSHQDDGAQTAEQTGGRTAQQTGGRTAQQTGGRTAQQTGGRTAQQTGGRTAETIFIYNKPRAPEGKCQSDEQDVYLEKQLERFEWQLRILKAVLSANGNLERAELLKHHADEEVCALVLSILDKVRTETTADLNVLHEQKSKTAAEEHDRILEELQKRQDQEKTALTQRFQAAEDVLKDKVEELTSDLQFYNQLKRRVESSTFKKDLQKNLQTHGRPGEFWESEQESLLYVIELRNDCVQEQNRKLRYMDALVEKNLALEDQISHVLQQKEDLREQLDSCQAVIQQLLEETKDLKVELESHVIINQKLTQEKEQLMFRLRNPDLCPTTLLPGVVQELAPR